VLGEQFQHVVEEADAGGDLVFAAAFNAEGAGDLRLFGIALDGGASHEASTSSR
jgi:hypothetical protein